MFIAFLHGQQMFFALVLAGIFVVITFPVLLYVWLWYTKVSEVKLAVAYFMTTAVFCVVLAFNPNNPVSIPFLTASALGFILSLPWSVLAGWAISEALNTPLGDPQFAVVMLFAAGINAVLLYFAAIKMRRLIQ